MDVYQLNQFINFVANKESTGEYLKPVDYNRLLQAANIELFNREWKKVKDILGGATVTAFARYAVGG